MTSSAAVSTLPSLSKSPEPHAALVRRVLSPLPDFHLVSPRDADRQNMESFIADRYYTTYNAQVTHFLPWLMAMQCHGQLSGAAGLQPAGAAPLYLERYLSTPVEQSLSVLAGHDIARTSVVEVGNLVASRRGASHLLFLMFTAVLYEAGYEWIVFTATRGLRNNLRKLEFPLVELHPVDVASLPDTLVDEWGSYYSTAPVVMAGKLEDAATLVQSKGLYRRIARLYRNSIQQLATQLAE